MTLNRATPTTGSVVSRKQSRAHSSVTMESWSSGDLDDDGQERRLDKTDGLFYTREDFIVQYGGTVEWDAAAPRKRARANVGTQALDKRSCIETSASQSTVLPPALGPFAELAQLAQERRKLLGGASALPR